MFNFGVSEVKITPKVGLNIPGYFEARNSKFIMDDLYAKACVFDDGNDMFFIVVCDLVELHYGEHLAIRKGASEKLGIDFDKISISVTHTHTAGPVESWGDVYSRDDEYCKFVVERAIEAIEKAYNSRRNASFGYKKSELHDVAFIRRFYLKDGSFAMNPPAHLVERTETEPDDTFFLGKVVYEDGTLAALIENYAIHADTIGIDLISGDYPGEVSRIVKEKYGNDVVNIFIPSASGDTNHFNIHDLLSMTHYHHVKVGRQIFWKIEEMIDDIELSSDVCVKSATARFMTKTRKPSKSDYEIALKILAGEEAGFPGYENEDYAPKRVFASVTKAAYESTVEEKEIEVKAARIGDLYFAAMPGEVFCEFAKIIRNEYPERDIAVSCMANNNACCYVPSKEGFKNGGYETRISCEVMPCEELGYEMTDKINALLKDM